MFANRSLVQKGYRFDMLVVFLSLIAVLTLAVFLFKNKRRQHNLPPGPYGLPLVGHIPFLDPVEPQKTFSKLADKYGDVFTLKLGMKTMIFLNTKETIRECLKEEVLSNRPSGMIIDELWCQRETGVAHGVVFNSGASWREQRLFLLRQLRDFGFGKQTMEQIISDEVNQSVRIMEKEVGKPIDFQLRFELAVLNSFWYLISGEKFAQDDKRLNDILDKFVKRIEEMNLVTGIAFLFPFTRWLCPKLLGLNAVKLVVDDIFDIAKSVFDRHVATFKEDQLRDITDAYIQQIKDTTDQNSTFYGETGAMNAILGIMDLFGAGLETTSSALQWIGLYLIYYPDEQKKIQDEIVNIVGGNTPPCLADKERMPYTEAFIHEVLRHSSPIPLSVFHAATEDTKYRDWIFPKGVIIVPNTYHVHHDRRYWGDPDVFRPERFLDEEGQFRPDDGFVLFTPGQRKCVGESLARNTLFLFLTGILQRFDLRSVPGVKLSLKPHRPHVSVHPQLYKLIPSRRAH